MMQQPRNALAQQRRSSGRPLLRCRASSSSLRPSTATQPPAVAQHDALRDPAHISARGKATVRVRDRGGTLSSYMQLPVDEYYVLDAARIEMLGGDTFVLTVPPLQLFGSMVTLAPRIWVQVITEPDAVLLQSTACKLNATGILADLDSIFALRWSTRLTWQSAGAQPQQPQQQQQPPQQPPQQQLLPAKQQQQQQPQLAARQPGLPPPAASGSSAASQGTITGSASIDVWCEVVPPFGLMPREVLEASCSSALAGLVNSLLPWFMRSLAADAEKWADDEAYRRARRVRAAQRRGEA